VAKSVLGILMVLAVVGCGEEKHYASDGASVAMICRDGSRIMKYVDGTYHVLPWGDRVEDINKVCQN
jgi:hypothetical protein